MFNIPILQTRRLIIRPLAAGDVDEMVRVMDGLQPGDPAGQKRRDWLNWMADAAEHTAAFRLPQYVDRAVTLRDSGALIGAVGFVAELEPFESLPYLGGRQDALCTPEISLYWEIGPAYRRQGYATEAALALVDYAFNTARVKRLFALTDPDNLASLGVMRKLGMYIERAQGACGILHNPLAGGNAPQ